jgi:hypothetical protein
MFSYLKQFSFPNKFGYELAGSECGSLFSWISCSCTVHYCLLVCCAVFYWIRSMRAYFLLYPLDCISSSSWHLLWKRCNTFSIQFESDTKWMPSNTYNFCQLISSSEHSECLIGFLSNISRCEFRVECVCPLCKALVKPVDSNHLVMVRQASFSSFSRTPNIECGITVARCCEDKTTDNRNAMIDDCYMYNS